MIKTIKLKAGTTKIKDIYHDLDLLEEFESLNDTTNLEKKDTKKSNHQDINSYNQVDTTIESFTSAFKEFINPPTTGQLDQEISDTKYQTTPDNNQSRSVKKKASTKQNLKTKKTTRINLSYTNSPQKSSLLHQLARLKDSDKEKEVIKPKIKKNCLHKNKHCQEEDYCILELLEVKPGTVAIRALRSKSAKNMLAKLNSMPKKSNHIKIKFS
jgi:hypothetical protein